MQLFVIELSAFLLEATITIKSSQHQQAATTKVKHFPRNGDIAVTESASGSLWFRLAAGDADNWVSHYSLITQVGSVGAFFQREEKLSNTDDWIYQDNTGAEKAVLKDLSRRSRRYFGFLPLFDVLAPHRLSLQDLDGREIARYTKGAGFRYRLAVESSLPQLDETVICAAGVLATVHHFRTS